MTEDAKSEKLRLYRKKTTHPFSRGISECLDCLFFIMHFKSVRLCLTQY